MATSRYLWIVLTFWCAPVFSAEPKCIDKEPTPDKDHLQCLISTDVVRQVRKDFESALKHRRTCPKCPRLSVTEDEFVSLYRLPFLVIAIAYPTHGSGYDVHVVFKGRQQDGDYIVRMEYLPNDTFKLKVMGDSPSSIKTTDLIRELNKEEYARFWLP